MSWVNKTLNQNTDPLTEIGVENTISNEFEIEPTKVKLLGTVENKVSKWVRFKSWLKRIFGNKI